MIFEIDDGVDDGDDSIDLYLIPTWGTETYQEVLKRYFQVVEEANGRLRSVRTLEYDPNHEITGWNWHNVSNLSWWTVYLSSFEDSVVPFHERAAVAESRLLLRFNADSDGDQYSDRTEVALGTDPFDANSHPNAGLIAGYAEERDGNTVEVQLAFQNFGLYDASGIEAVIYAPDDSVMPGAHLVGGAGLVRAGRRVNLGSKVGKPGLANWTGSAQPVAGGHYTGDVDKVYTFTAGSDGTVGQIGGLALDWSDGTGASGSLNVGSGYNPPWLLSVAEGIEVGLGSGEINASESFTVTALISRDVFTYIGIHGWGAF